MLSIDVHFPACGELLNELRHGTDAKRRLIYEIPFFPPFLFFKVVKQNVKKPRERNGFEYILFSNHLSPNKENDDDRSVSKSFQTSHFNFK